MTVKAPRLVAVLPGAVTAILPVVAAAGTVALIRVASTTLNTADVPLNVTRVAAVKPPPEMVTCVPTRPDVGLKPVMVSRAGVIDVTVKLAVLVPVPDAVVTAMRPLLAPEGTVAVSCVALTGVNVAEVPLNVTLVTPLKPVPLTVTSAPTGPEVGLKLVSVGAVGAGALADTYALRHTLALLTREVMSVQVEPVGLTKLCPAAAVAACE
jgi:hypothetical protein